MTVHPLSDETVHELLENLSGQDNFVLLETNRITPDNHLSFLFTDPVALHICTPDDQPEIYLTKAQEWLDRGFYLAGWLNYEFGYLLEPTLKELGKSLPDLPIAVLGVYRQPNVYNHLDGSFVGVGPWQLPSKAAQQNLPVSKIHNGHLSMERDRYLENVRKIKRYIESGDTYQVNYTLKYHFDFEGSPSSLYRSLRRNQSVSYGAYIKNGPQHILSLSPELFFNRQGRRITVRPMKGTMPRGRTSAEDLDLAAFLKNDVKNRSENIMIVDLLRNDLGRLCEMGSVQAISLFDVETYETLLQMTSTIQGELGHDATLHDLFSAIFPSGSVTGAPKIRTMEIINELEETSRGVYTGAIGYITPDGSAMFNVPIRTVVLENGRGEMGIGSGIVYDSEPENEWEECRLKSDFLTRTATEFQLIETILWRPGMGYWLLDLHLVRLLDSAHYFGYQTDRDIVMDELTRLAQVLSPDTHQRVRLTLAKDGSLSCTATPCPPPNNLTFDDVASNSSPLPRIRISSCATDSHSPYLFHKTTRRDLYDSEKEVALREGYYEVLFVNERGEITEGSISNIFVRKNGRILTPAQDCGLLNGILRRYLIQNSNEKIREAILTVKDLIEADALYVGNSVRGLMRVTL